MGENNRDPFDLVKRLAESYTNVKFGSGVVGKTSYAIAGVFLVWAIVLTRLTENLWFDLALIAGAGLVTYIYVWWVQRTQDFCRKESRLGPSRRGTIN